LQNKNFVKDVNLTMDAKILEQIFTTCAKVLTQSQQRLIDQL